MKINIKTRLQYRKLGGQIKTRNGLIISIKNLYTGNVFNVGDKIKFSSSGETEIKSFGFGAQYGTIAAINGNSYMPIVWPEQKKA
jgi:hypothetical protein